MLEFYIIEQVMLITDWATAKYRSLLANIFKYSKFSHEFEKQTKL